MAESRGRLHLSGMASPGDPTLSPYPTTRHSLVAAAGATDATERRAAVDALIRLYWRPAYGRLRLKWRLQAADAEDLVQEFFTGLIDGEIFADTILTGPGSAPTCGHAWTTSRRRRSGASAASSAGAARRTSPSTSPRPSGSSVRRVAGSADAWFDREWVRALLSYGVEELRSQTTGTAQEIRFRVFESYDLIPEDDAARPGYRDIAARFDIPVTQVNHLAWARRELRRLVLARLAEVTGSDAELQDEAEELFGGSRGDVA